MFRAATSARTHGQWVIAGQLAYLAHELLGTDERVELWGQRVHRVGQVVVTMIRMRREGDPVRPMLMQVVAEVIAARVPPVIFWHAPRREP